MPDPIIDRRTPTQVAEQIATAIRHARDGATWMTAGEAFAYDHAAGLADLLRVPDCGHQYHGADGGPCPRCGFDIATPAGGAEPTPGDPDA